MQQMNQFSDQQNVNPMGEIQNQMNMQLNNMNMGQPQVP